MLKGKTTIELTDVKTKEKEIYKDENIVTNAVPDLFSLNPSGLVYYMDGCSPTKFDENLFPIANKCYGGILLFQDTLEENTNKYFAPRNNQIIGYASNDVNPTDEKKRGSFNLTESGPIENGYKFVWDFSTSQGNGRISSLALTHFLGGRNFYGDDYGNSSMLRINKINKRTSDYNLARAYTCAVEANLEKNYLISIYPRSNKSIDIMKIREPFTTIGLNDPVNGGSKSKIDVTNIPAKDFFLDRGYDNLYHYFFDGKDGYWYGFNAEYGSDSTTLRRIKIKKDDLSTEISKWGLGNISLFRLGKYPSEDYASRLVFSTVKDGYLYTMSYDKKIIYKININNPVDISKINIDFDAKFDSVRDANIYIYNWGDYILGYNFLINSNDEVVRTFKKNNYSGILFEYACSNIIKQGPFAIIYGFYDERLYKNIFLNTSYLGTINNLSSPVLKTADKTMKITYTLTEEE